MLFFYLCGLVLAIWIINCICYAFIAFKDAYLNCLTLITGVLIVCFGMVLTHTTFMIRTKLNKQDSVLRFFLRIIFVLLCFNACLFVDVLWSPAGKGLSLFKTIPRRCFFVDHFCYFCLVLLCFHARLSVDALWSPARKGLTSWLSFVKSNCDVVTFPLVSWVRFGA